MGHSRLRLHALQSRFGYLTGLWPLDSFAKSGRKTLVVVSKHNPTQNSVFDKVTKKLHQKPNCWIGELSNWIQHSEPKRCSCPKLKY